MTDQHQQNDPRDLLDPRIQRALKYFPTSVPGSSTTREQMVAAAASQTARTAVQRTQEFLESMCGEDLVTSDGLSVERRSITSAPDGNDINLIVTRPTGDAVVPVVVYLHGGGMASMSCEFGNYRALARMIAHHGVAVVLVDFRNSIAASSVPEVAPFPAGLNDCVSAVRWVRDHADELGVDAARLVVSGESGGGNLTLATGLKMLADGDIDAVKGLYAFAPYIAGEWPVDRHPSTIDNDGIMISPRSENGQISYGIDAWNARDITAWPGLATAEQLVGLPPTVISVNECDPLRDEGIAFYRTLLDAGVSARCRQIMGTMHATEAVPFVCPDISEDAAAHLATFAAR